MITLTLEMDFPESENAKILQKLSELLEKNNKVKVKELRVGESISDSLTWPQTTLPYTPTPLTSPPSYPNITWTCNASDISNVISNGETFVDTLSNTLTPGEQYGS